MAKIISVTSQKGGVGKTTTSHNLGCALAKLGRKVLLIDLDKQCNLTMACGTVGEFSICDLIYSQCMGRTPDISDAIIHSQSGIDYIASSQMLDAINSQIACDSDSAFVLKKILSSSEVQAYDYVICDNKPAIDILTQNSLNASDYVIIPVEAGLFAFDGIDGLLNKIASLNATTNPKLKVLGILYNKAENVTKIGREIAEATQQAYGDKLFKTAIPYRKAQTEQAIASQNGCVNLKRNTLGEAYISLATEIINKAEGGMHQ